MKTLALPLFCALLGLAHAQNWDQWRGPTRDGYVSGKWPEKLGGLKEVWRKELGASYSGTIVVGQRVFTTESRDKTYEGVKCFDRRTGALQWEKEWEGFQKVPFFAAKNGDWIRATPACDGEHIYVAGMRDVLVCLAASNGQEKWRVDFVKKFDAAPPAFGFVSSPLVSKDHIYVQAGAAVCKLDKKSGQVLWRSLEDGGGMWGSAFSSPYMAKLAGTTQLLVQTREYLSGLNPDDGTPLWKKKIPAFRGMNILTPVVKGDRVYTTAYGGQSLAFQARKSESGTTVDLAWEHKAEGYMSTPVVIAGKIFLHLRNQRFTCLDLATGTQHWVTDEKFGEYWSLVTNGQRILALDERGILYLIQPSPEKFILLDQRKISEADTWAHLTVCGSELFVRERKALVCYRWE